MLRFQRAARPGQRIGLWYDIYYGFGFKIENRIRMQRGEAIAILKEHEAELRKRGIEHLYLFGSTARGEVR